ncbi:MAG: hypothetical protein P8Y07_00915 [Gemmatimonadales bacterium]
MADPRLSRGAMPIGSRCLSLALLATAALMGLAGCAEDAIVAVDPDVPGATVPTVEISAVASDLEGWQDTTYSGFELPATSGFKLLADRADLLSRDLGRFDVPDSIITSFGIEEIDPFVDASFRVALDFGADPDSVVVPNYQLQVFALEESFDSLSATWTDRREGDPWILPGGTLGELLASGDFIAAVDTAVLEFSAPVDEVLEAWQETDGEPGVALVMVGGPPELAVTSFDLATQVMVVGRADTVPATFFSRGVQLGETTINHAELRFRPLPPPEAPFPLGRAIVATAVEVLADAFEVGAKVPVGAPIPDPQTGVAQFISVTPEGLEEGHVIRVNVTRLVELVAGADTLTQVRLTVRAAPTDGQAFGFWDFGSVESPLSLQPELRMLVTPPIGFPVP